MAEMNTTATVKTVINGEQAEKQLEKLYVKYIQKTHEDDRFYANIGYSFLSCLTISTN